MVAKKFIIVQGIFVFVFGCYDTASDPKVQNGYPHNIQVEVIYSDGDESQGTWPPCRTVYIGHPKKEIEYVTVKTGGEIAHTYDKGEIEKLLSEMFPAVEVWTIDATGLTPRRSIHCH